MKKPVILVGSALMILLSSSLLAQSGALASASSEARIVSGLALVNLENLSFGQVVRSNTPGEVIIDVAGSRTSTGGVALGQNGNARAASFQAAGENGYSYTVTLPSSIVLTREGGSETMVVDNFISSVTNHVFTNGTQEFSVGATLHVGANQATGTYSGRFDVTAMYN